MKECKILIIDDDTDDVEILVKAFKDNGITHMHHHVLTGPEAFVYLQELKVEQLPKIIITDSLLSGMSGAEFLAKLKTIELYKHIPVVVLSGSTTPRDVARYRQLGASDFIEKPNHFDGYIKVAADIKSKIKL